MKSNSKDPSATDGAGKAAAISPPISPERLRKLYSSMLELRSANKRSKKPNKRRERTILPSEACVVACEAIEKARRGAGPTVIQCIRYEPRLAKKGSRIGEAADSLAYMEHYLHTRNLWSDELKIAPRHKSSVASRTSSKAKALGSLH